MNIENHMQAQAMEKVGGGFASALATAAVARADENHRAAKAMEKVGGGFASALAVAYFHADADNQARILAAWPELFERYRQMARRTSA